MLRHLPTLVLLVACTLVPPAQAADEFFLRPADDMIVFLGDSITEQRMYTAYLEAYVLTRFPDWQVRFRNAGWGSDTSWMLTRHGIDYGLKRDVLPLRPKAVTICYGMNDARGGEANLPKYRESQAKLAQDLTAAGARVALITPSPMQGSTPDHAGVAAYNQLLLKYSESLKQVAQEHGVFFVDQITGFLQVMAAGYQAKIPNFVLIPDSIHPNWAGHLVMAHQILKGMHAPALVSSAQIDAATQQVKEVQRCAITDLKAEADSLSFTRQDACLPLPIKPESELVFQVPGYSLASDLNQYLLRITGLAAGKHTVSLEGEPVGSFSAEQLAAGVNLSLHCGVISRQGLQLLDKILEKNDNYFKRWRIVQVWDLPYWACTPENDALRKKELARLDALIADQEAQIDALRQPVAHRWTVIREE